MASSQDGGSYVRPAKLDGDNSGQYLPLRVSADGRLLVDLEGTNVSGTFNVTPSVESALNEPSAPLAANEAFTGEWEEVIDYSAIQIAVSTDAASATNGAIIQFSEDATNPLPLKSVATTVPANTASYFHLAPQARFVRFVYTNGPVAQTTIRVSILFAYNPPSEVVQPIGATITDLNAATVTRSALTTRIMSGASTGVYVPVGNDGTGRALVSDQHSQPVTDAQLRASAVPVALDGSSLAALETISVANFPASQPVSGPLTNAELRAAAVAVAEPASAREATLTSILTELRRRPVFKTTTALTTVAAGSVYATVLAFTPTTDCVIVGYNADFQTLVPGAAYRMRLILGADATPDVRHGEEVSVTANAWTPLALSVTSGTRVAVQIIHDQVTSQSIRGTINYREDP